MELTYEEKLKLDNSKEHLKVVQSNLRIANEELSHKIKTCESLEEKIKELNSKIVDLNRYIAHETEVIQEKKIAQDKREESLLIRENSLNNMDRDLKNKINSANVQLNETIKETSVIKSNNQKLLDEYALTVRNLEESKNKVIAQINVAENTYNEYVSKIKELSDDIARLISEKDKQETELRLFRISSSKEIERINNLIESEKQKLSVPLANLRLEQKKLETLENDLRIIKRRMSKQYTEQNSNKLLPIELR